MSERDEIDILAGEYVLGTLDAVERTAVSARRQRDPALNAAIAAWEHRLAPLADTVLSVAAPEALREKIEALADARVAEDATQIVVLARRAERWRRLAIAASALAACLLMTIGVREFWRPPVAKTYVAVFQKDDASPSFVLTVDLDTRMLSVRPVAAEPQPGKSYQLWMASEKFGAAPRSLGLIDAQASAPQRLLANYDPALVERATFGISLEPAGGSPTGRPTGPAFHAKLIETTR